MSSLFAPTDEQPGLADSRRLSVLLLIRSLTTGGTERQLVQLARGLHHRGHRVTVAVFYRLGPLLAELEQSGIPILDLQKGGRWDMLGFLARTRRAIAHVHPDVVYSFLGTANVVAAVVRPFTSAFRLVWSIRSSDVDLSTYDWTHRLGYALEQRLSRAADRIISNSHAGLEFAVAHGFPRQRIAVVANGIDTDRFRLDARLRAAQRTIWGLGSEDIAVGVLGRLDPMKGYPTFLRAAAIALRSKPEMRFLCIGEGPEEGRLKTLAAELELGDRVLFTGHADPVAAVNALDVGCSASFTEGFSNAIAEAMACGLPCVVTDVGDSALIVGGIGRTVRRSDPDALAAALIDEAAALSAGRSEQARARIVDAFSVDAMVDRTLALLTKD